MGARVCVCVLMRLMGAGARGVYVRYLDLVLEVHSTPPQTCSPSLVRALLEWWWWRPFLALVPLRPAQGLALVPDAVSRTRDNENAAILGLAPEVCVDSVC